MLKVINFTKSYDGKKNVVEDLSLRVEKGEIFGFVGHNGAGKTTLIKAIVGIHDFDSGDILIDGISIKDNPIMCKKSIAYIPDNPDIYQSLTGIEYLNFIADVFEVGKKDRESLIKKYATELELYDDLNSIIGSYSHGMKQKLVIIGALIHSPKLLILDEPFVGLDPKASFKLKEIMKERCRNGMSIFFSSHVLEVVEKLCDNVGIIKNGNLVIVDEVKKVVKNKSLENLFLEINNE